MWYQHAASIYIYNSLRLISGREPSDELRIFQRLNTKEARADPRNHSIHVLEYIAFDGLIFIVMPRYAIADIAAPFF